MATSIVGDFTVFVKTATVVFGDTSATRLWDLPAHAHVIDIKVDVQTAFSGGTTELDIGKHSDTDYFADGVDISGTGRATVTVLEGGEDLGSRLTEVQIQVGASNTAGAATVTFLYFCFDRSHLH
jgi:hypothetical protein